MKIELKRRGIREEERRNDGEGEWGREQIKRGGRNWKRDGYNENDEAGKIMKIGLEEKGNMRGRKEEERRGRTRKGMD